MFANKPDIPVERLELLVIAKNAELLAAGQEVSEYFGFRAGFWGETVEVPREVRSGNSPAMILVELTAEAAVIEKMQVLKGLRDLFPRSQLVVVVQGGESVDDCEFLRGAGAQYLILSQEVRSTSKLYYLAALLIQGTYLPIPVTDLFPSTQLNFNAYQKLVLNQKFLPVAFSGFTFSDKKYRRLEPDRQIYVRRESLEGYRKYIETYNDRTGSALKKRCRVLMMEVLGLYTEVILLLALDSEVAKKEVVQNKLSQFTKVAVELRDHLKDCADVWNVMARALDFQFCKQERGVIVLAYALYLADGAGAGEVENLVLTALLADIGLLDLPATTYKNLKTHGVKRLSAEELERFRGHPMASLNRIMFRQVDVPVAVRSAIVCTHERNDRKGFPNQVPAEKIPTEAKLVSFCEILDRRVRASLEDGMVTHDFVRKQVWEEERDSLKGFDAEFLDKIQKLLVA